MLLFATRLPNVKDELLVFIWRAAGGTNGRGRAEAGRARLTAGEMYMVEIKGMPAHLGPGELGPGRAGAFR